MVEVEIKKKRQIEATSRLADCPDLFNQKWAYLSSIQMYIQKRKDTIIEAFSWPEALKAIVYNQLVQKRMKSINGKESWEVRIKFTYCRVS